jgi:hypothetical protein
MITSNTIWGFPSFSKNDSKIAFSSLGSGSVEIVATINLSQNKISASGSAATLINYAKWPVYFANGERILGLSPVSNFTADVKTGNTPLQVKFIDLSINKPTSWQWTFMGGTPSSSTLQNPVVSYNTSGTYSVVLTTQNSFGNNTNTRESYITVTAPTGVNDNEINRIKFYPNPVTDIINIDYEKDLTIKLFDLYGHLLLTGRNNKTLDLSGIKPGLYILEIKTEEGLSRQKLIKR